MGLISRSLGINNFSFEDPAQPLLPPSALFESMGLGRSDAGILINEKQALRLTTAFACISVISQDLGRLPLSVYQRMPDDSVREAREHKLYPILHDEPNPWMTAATFRGALIASILGWGNAYVYIERDKAARVKALKPLPSDKTSAVFLDGVLGFATTATKNGAAEYIDAENMLHLVGLSMDGIVGLSPVQTCKNAFGLSLAAEKFGAQFFGSGARATGVLSHPGTLDAEAYENLKKSVREWATGETALRPIILEEGMKWEQITINPNDAQFLATRQFQRSEIAALYRVPLHLLQDLQRATNNNIEHQSLDYVRYCLAPLAVRIEQEINRKLLTGSYFCEHDLNDIMRGDFASQTTGFQSLRNIGVLSTNDILRSMRKNPISAKEGGDVRTIQGAMIPLTALTDDQWQNSQGGQEEEADAGADQGREDPPAGNLAHWQISAAYRRLFRDVVGRAITRTNDAVFVKRSVQPILASMVEALNAMRFGTAAVTDADQAKIADLVDEITTDCHSWTRENADESAKGLAELACRRLGEIA
jgi:HK97 family phage portal protein